MAAAAAASLASSALSSSLLSKHRNRNAADTSSSPERQMGIMEVESVLNRSLRHENDLLRCQLNDLVHREKAQRIELQRLRQHKDFEVTSMVNSGTSQLKAEVKQLRNMLKSTSEQLLQTLNEREQASSQKEQCARALEELKLMFSTQEHQLQQRLQTLEEAFRNGVNTVALLVDSVGDFQRHVLPTFKPSEFQANKGSLQASIPCAAIEGNSLMEHLTRLEHGLALLRLIVDAKNDTLFLIRGKLKQENDELKAELQVLQEASQGPQPRLERTTPSFESTCGEKNVLRKELHSLQNVFNDEVKQLKSKLNMYESEEQHDQGHIIEVQRELAALQSKLGSVEASRALLEDSLKEETAARSQLISQLFTLRKDNEKTKTELETLKLSQKFLVRQPRSGRIPSEKLDLMNTVNQLLGEINKLKGEKFALEEEVKAQKRSQVSDRIKASVTTRDVELAASNKVGDTELASKLARARLQQLGMRASEPASSAATPSSCVVNDVCSAPPPGFNLSVVVPTASTPRSPQQPECWQTNGLQNGLQGTQMIDAHGITNTCSLRPPNPKNE